MTLRHVVIHPALGVLLALPKINGAGDNWDKKVQLFWSGDGPTEVTFAPTFECWAQVDLLLNLFGRHFQPGVRQRMTLKEVFPDIQKKKCVSHHALRAAGIVSWDPEVADDNV